MIALFIKWIQMCVLFFFKQKTAYEMRISDWSSDVCSSDLHRAGRVVPKFEHRRLAVAGKRVEFRGRASSARELLSRHDVLDRQSGSRPRTGSRAGSAARPKPERGSVDRRSVVWGKSVAVRGDLGGRRIIKKKTPNR